MFDPVIVVSRREDVQGCSRRNVPMFEQLFEGKCP
jgi:hypothetical protein